MSFLKLPDRSKKPRNNGISMIIDNGYGTNLFEDYLAIAGDFIDMIKFGWGTAVITNNLKEKIKICNKYNIKTYLGGTLFELAVFNKKIEELITFSKELNIDILEISDGTINLDKQDKNQLISLLSKKFTIISEIGSKDDSPINQELIDRALEQLEAGAWKVIFEGRESGSVGIYNSDNSVKKELVEIISKTFKGKEEKIIWETPTKSQQSWFINYLGNNVNLGNIKLSETISLETLRLGLRSDTFFKFT